jgi:hypothetical protein
MGVSMSNLQPKNTSLPDSADQPPQRKAKRTSKRRSRFAERLSFYLFTKRGRKKIKAHALGLAILFLTLLQIGKWVYTEVVSLFGR